MLSFFGPNDETNCEKKTISKSKLVCLASFKAEYLYSRRDGDQSFINGETMMLCEALWSCGMVSYDVKEYGIVYTYVVKLQEEKKLEEKNNNEQVLAIE